MSWGLVGSAAIGVGGSILMGSLSGGGGGGGGGSMSGMTAAQMDAYIQATAAERDAMLRQVRNLSERMVAKIEGRGEDYLNKLTKEEQVAIERLTNANNWLADETNRQSENFASGVNAILSDLVSVNEKLNIEEKDSLTAQINDYQKQASDLTKNLEGRLTDADRTYQGTTSAAISGFDSASKSLSDTFLASAKSAQDNFTSDMGQALSLSPERLSVISNAADYLSKATQRTRMDLLATADPRALELSAIADENASAMMSGRISADVQANLARTGAMRALQGGFAGGQMQRNLEARDLGLTSLDLQQRGTAMYDAQRRLNYDTRVAGTQVDAMPLLANDINARVNQANTLLGSRMQTAESNRNQLGAAQNAIFGARMGVADTRRLSEIDAAKSVFDASSGQARDILGMNLTNTSNFYGNARDLSNTVAGQQLSATGRLFDVGLDTARSQYATNVNAASNFYQTNAGALGNVYTTDTNAYTNAANMRVDATKLGFTTMAAARGAAAQANLAAAQQDMLNNQQTQANNNAMWSSIINTGQTALGWMSGQGSKSNTPSWTGLNTKTGFYGDASSAASAYGVDPSKIGFYPGKGYSRA